MDVPVPLGLHWDLEEFQEPCKEPPRPASWAELASGVPSLAGTMGVSAPGPQRRAQERSTF